MDEAQEATTSSRRASDAAHEQPSDAAVSAQDPALERARAHALEADVADLHACKLLNEKQAAELNAKELLLARKNERIDELVQQLQARDALLDAASGEVREREAAAKLLRAELEELRDQLRKDEDDFSLVSAALEAKELALARKSQALGAAGDVERQVRKELDKAQAAVRRLEKSVEELQPEQADACLSPRSFRENQLIALRDDALAAKSREVWLLSGQNDQLRGQLDDLEAAMAQLQTAFVAKENDGARTQRRVAKLEAELEALHASRSQAEGREKAMEIATTQNRKLLLALEAQERRNDELAERAERAERECAQLRETHHAFLATAAASEAEVIHRTKAAEEKSSVVSALQEKLQRERRALQEELASARLRCQLETDKLESELVMRRNKQYELTLRLQDADARLHRADDARESASEQLLASTCRMQELERVLHDALEWKRRLEHQLETQAADAARTSDELARQLRAAQAEVATLTTQLGELKDALVKQRSLEKRLERDVLDFRQLVDAKDALVRETRERVQRLVHEVNREAQSRAELELERQVLREQLERVRGDSDGAIRAVEAQTRRAQDRLAALQEKLAALEAECAKEQAGKAKLVLRFADAFAATALSAAAARSAWLAAEVLDLRDCWLGDRDLVSLLRALEFAPDALTRVDLRGNRLTMDGMRAVAAFAKKLAVGWLGAGGSSSSSSRCRVRDIDLRCNFVSLDGVRVVASSLESLCAGSTSLKSVVVTSGGRIECFADARVVGDSAANVPVLIVDVSANFDADVLIAEARKKTRRRVRDADVGGGGAGSTQPRDAQLQETYGVDLVSVLLGGESGTARRKAPGLFEKPKAALPVAGGDGTSVARSSSNNAALLSPTQSSPVAGGSWDASSSRLLGSSSLPRLSG